MVAQVASGQRLIDGADAVFNSLTMTNPSGFIYESSVDSVVAFAGGGQGSATVLTAQTVRVITVATAGDSVRLPASRPGLELMVINSGANSMQVYGSGSDVIDAVATAIGVSHMPSSLVIYTCVTAGSWFTEGIGTGYSGSFPTSSYTNNITAFGGGGQASATLLTTVLNRVVTIVTAADSVKLPIAVPGLQLTIANAHAANSLNLFPGVGDQINALGSNIAFAVAAGKTCNVYCMNTLQWHAVLTA